MKEVGLKGVRDSPETRQLWQLVKSVAGSACASGSGSAVTAHARGQPREERLDVSLGSAGKPESAEINWNP